jgi:cytochrome c oxidase assembly protein subunit 11
MGALSFAAVPLYRMFCQVTGFGGTTQRAEKAPDVVLDRMVTIRFDANVVPGMAWSFEPEQRTMRVKVGENVLAFYKASNTSEGAITGTASFNVSPDIAGSYFSKIECFCFKEQTLAAGETVEMPVSFFVDPKIAGDRDADAVQEITLSYTFYPVSKSAARSEPGKDREGG